MNKVRTIFIGTSDFAVPILNALFSQDFIKIVAIITQPDRPTGRRQILTSPPVKQLSDKRLSEFKYLVIQPEKINFIYEDIKKLNPELIIVASYGQIISEKILSLPRFGSLNVHASLLPRLRGAVPIPMSILRGFTETGVTLQKMVFQLDAGDIISSRKYIMSGLESTESLTTTLSNLGAEIILQDLKKWINGELAQHPQDTSLVSYCTQGDIAKTKAELGISTTVDEAEKMIRAFNPWPIVWFTLNSGIHKGKKIKIFGAKKSNFNDSERETLSLYRFNKDLYLKLADGSLQILNLQLEGKQRDTAQKYLYLAI